MRFRRIAGGMVTTVIGTVLVVGAPAAASAATGSAARPAVMAAQNTLVNSVPAKYTPDVNNGVVYAIGQSGPTVFLGGDFTSVSPHGSSTTYADNYITAFTAGTGDLVTSFAPVIDGQVNTIIAGPTAGTVYVGGSFKHVDGVTTKLALLNTTTGALVPGFRAPAFNGAINQVVLRNGQLFVGGTFTSASQPRGGLAVLNPTTGALLGSYTVPSFTGHHNYGRLCDPTRTHCSNAGVGIKSMDVSPDGTRLIAIGNFVTATDGTGAYPRDQIALVDLGATSATVDQGWASAAYSAACASWAFDSYVRDVQFSADGSYFVVVATGGNFSSKNADGTKSSCDAAARYETTGSGADVRPSWIDYTGNDTFLSVAVTGTAVYVGGHQRWVNNSLGSDRAAGGSVPRPGLVALDPVNGMPLAWNPGRNPRGAGAYSLLATSDGLYVGSDTDYIGPHYNYHHKKIDFFPLAGGQPLASNTIGSLPGNIFLIGGANPSQARETHWDGTTAPSAPTALTTVDWSSARGAFAVNGNVYYGSTDGNFYERPFDGTTFGPATTIDPYDDPIWSDVDNGSGGTYRGVKSGFYSEMSSLTSLFYSNGRVFYTLAGKSQMFWRWFETDSGVMGADEFTVSGGPSWSTVSGAFLAGSTLYFANSQDHKLYSVAWTGTQTSGTPAVADSSMDWTSRGAFVLSGPQPPPNQSPNAAFDSNCSTLTCSFDAGASNDPDGSIAGYAWNWGDGKNAQDTNATDSHTYANPGTYQVTLTVTDNRGGTATVTHNVAVTSAAPQPITFRAAAASDPAKAAGSINVTVPTATNAGDTLLLFETYASTSITATAPAGWTLVGTTNYSNLSTAVYSKSADAGDPGSTVSVTYSTSVKATLTVAAYSNAASNVEASASATDRSTNTHTSPTVSGLLGGSLAVTFWADKSTTTTVWTPPNDVTKRSDAYGNSGGALSELLADSGNGVSGSYGNETATTDVTSGSGASWTIGLAPTG